MKSMKEATPNEVQAIKRRALRSLAMERISKEDCDYIVQRCDEIEAHVTVMWERDDADPFDNQDTFE